MKKAYRIEHRNALAMQEAIGEVLEADRLASGLNAHLVSKAWNAASGAERYTIRTFYRGGRLHVTLSSAVVRSQLSCHLDAIILQINKMLLDDILYSGRRDGGSVPVEEIILK
ncbi:MAG: DUF721 domain-containing protein [Bacteroidales bacterium]|nr:DUF721 domain-containing protein [Bacteroidales bacterium]